jgi:hypothetical protein
LLPAHPGLADGQGFISDEPQAQRKAETMSEAKLSKDELRQFTGSEH